MIYLYFVGLLLFFCWLITRLPWFNKTGIGAKLLVSLFLLRIIAALTGYYFTIHYYDNADPLLYHRFSLEESDLLYKDFSGYLSNLFTSDYANGYSGFFDTSQSYWNNLGSNVVIKLLSLFNLISFKNFLINTLLYNFLIFFGSVALYKTFIVPFPHKKAEIIFIFFFFPSALLFTSIVHKDGLVFLSLSMVIYHLYFWRNNYFTWRRLLAIIFFLLLIFVVRGYVFIVLLPAIAAWMLAETKPAKSSLIFSGLYVIYIFLFFTSSYISPALHFPKYVSDRQAAFHAISDLGASTIPTRILYPALGSFVKNTPQALEHSFLRPYLSEGNWLYIPFSLETTGFVVLILLFLVFKRKKQEVPPIIFFMVFFSITMFLVIGFTIPILGAIVRYRSIFFTFLFFPLIIYTDWEKALKKLNILKNKNQTENTH